MGQCVINMCSCALNHDAMSRFLCPIGVIISLSLAMSECSLSWRGQCHVSNFYIVDLENFATASLGTQVISTTRPSSVCL